MLRNINGTRLTAGTIGPDGNVLKAYLSKDHGENSPVIVSQHPITREDQVAKLAFANP